MLCRGKQNCLILTSWAQLHKGRMTLPKGEIAIQRISDRETYSAIHQIEIYPVDSVIYPSNNQGLVLTPGVSQKYLRRKKAVVGKRVIERKIFTQCHGSNEE